jgi:ABC-type lipoprotein export system ATPase subunit
MARSQWPYPGSRWWKFDFHTHTPASKDTTAWQNAINTAEEITAEKWLLKYMAAEIDCLAVTDHNSGEWVNTLKTAYEEMKARSLVDENGFRALTIFPGGEISANGGIHVLAIFDPEKTSSDIDILLGQVDYQGSKGDSDGVTSKGIAEVIHAIEAAGAIAIPAHADQDKGLLQCKADSKKSALDANTVRQAIEVEGLLAVEWRDPDSPWPECAREAESRLARVLGSDCHNFQGENVPGSRYTWVKMACPTLEGLRLALLDGNGVSVRCSDEDAFDPFRVPAHVITAIEIENARYIGNGKPTRTECSPFFNAIVGGRGTGKSTLVHALRLATRREQELKGVEGEPLIRFEEFRRVAKGRDDKGALKDETEIRVEWQHEDARLRLRWRADGQGDVVEECKDKQWQASSSQSVNADRFPVRIFSQGQIAAIAGSGRQTLLSIIDEAANVETLKQAFEEAQRTFFVQRARLRELNGKLSGLPEIERKLGETEKKLETLSQTGHAAVLRAFARAQHQRREVNTLIEQLGDGSARIGELSDSIALDDWPEQYFSEQDAEILAWRKEADKLVEQTRADLQKQAGTLTVAIEALKKDARLAVWRERVQKEIQAHFALQEQLKEQGVSDPQAFARLTQDKQQLETQRKVMLQMQGDCQALALKIKAQRELVVQKRGEITKKREDFIQRTLAGNEYVCIEIVPFGFEPKKIERDLRELLEVNDERFASDILLFENDEAKSGMAFDLAQAKEAEKIALIDGVKNRLLNTDDGFDGRFRNYLNRKHEKPEFSDHILVWFPEDDLRIEYQRENKWTSILEGSQGQRSAALLAFLLAFGEEPIILDQPEDDLDNHLIYDLIVRQIRENKLRRQLVIVTHNPNVVINGDAELVHAMEFGKGQCFVRQSGALQEKEVRAEVCRVMEGGHEAFARRWKRLGKEI